MMRCCVEGFHMCILLAKQHQKTYTKNTMFQSHSMQNMLAFLFIEKEGIVGVCIIYIIFRCTIFVLCIVSSLKNGELDIFMRSSGYAQPHKYFGDTIFLMVNKKKDKTHINK